ncbi:PTS glucose transporter subunit IIA [Paenibacillus oralis]|uniref:PTS glucose transporter subunit IIA n=1 Tax=Paenibacillus oralis TaxID=2490856 RepID=A0A3P3U3C5_9BACL|nr:PTS glucose transporter subunit IIA [Paenibacillus oralis]RRJ64862.1 PTS glucose transporter subunit IIA [Paenibacillus oralis]
MFGRKKKNTPQEVLVAAPLIGKVVSIEEVEDEAFSSKAMGEGIAINPYEGKVIAPFDGTVAHIMEKSKHALVLEHESGIQILIHVGMNTVSLKGEGFTAHVGTGEKIKKGQLLLEFDIELIQQAGYPVVTPVIVPVGQELVKRVDILQNSNDDTRPDIDLLRIVL